MTKNLTLKVPEGTRADESFRALIRGLSRLAIEHQLYFAVGTGECIAPISVGGDLDLQTAEEIKQRALALVAAWKEGTK